MPLTEIMMFELMPAFSFTSRPVLSLLYRLANRQSAYSSYPLTFYGDVNSSARIYIISGWRSVNEYAIWKASSEMEELVQSFNSYLINASIRHLAMDFDTIPIRTGLQSLLCLLFHQPSPGSTNSPDPSSLWQAEEDGIPLPVSWMSGGDELDSSFGVPAFCRLILYGDVRPEVVEWKHRACRERVLCRRIVLPRPS
ncbi:hypothetical protein C8J56DRAFT_978827 [Mycena floridula]|nr:hypothetical protein C8J56DRAFT_978827 [Mycena floridula]